ncbi:DUF5696 domain-containing protein [Cohnella fermenti]|uniref:Uncharacterized protein n=1 Tax=Cohnella fermenti TaxID=2565925 RepID=A0A4S4C6R5_9BACL|nr:DUF5696 domain-containing protein [Cohnella fermenti]THF83298.1 hypothetical protein E6C55_05445 [Cohnella fermenti]
MKRLTGRQLAYLAAGAALLLILAWSGWRIAQIRHAEAGPAEPIAVPADAVLFKPELPQEAGFRKAAESAELTLLVDPATAHFQVVSKSTGLIWRSYPEPEEWAQETIGGVWKNNLLSPIIVEYANLSNYKSASKTVGLADEGGYVDNLETKEDGFSGTFVLPKGGFKIPFEVTLKDDYVETTLLEDGLREGDNSLLNVKLYPLFGGQTTEGQDGYLFVPDGSGALIRFKQDRVLEQSTYNYNIYGGDPAFYQSDPNRQRIALPVFGLKSGDRGFVSIVTEGAAYASVFAAPSGSLGSFNWIAAEWQYRKRFFQSVSRKTDAGFFTYGKERFELPRRTVRYYPLGGEDSDYVGMAGVYRSYLVDEQKVTGLTGDSADIPLYVDLIGADVRKGLLIDEYVTATTTADAKKLLQNIVDQGIRRVVVQYAGWQQDGYSEQGGYFPVDSRIGGDDGMRSFIEFAHAYGIPVYLTADYTINNNGEDGYWYRRDGARSLSGEVQELYEGTTRVSAGFYRKTIASDLQKYARLGADGIRFEGGIGSQLVTDYNSRYGGSRADAIAIQREVLEQTKTTLGSVAVSSANAYAFDLIDHVPLLAAGDSYDLYTDDAVPFAQIVLHGLLPYTSQWSNLRNESHTDFLQMIEYGAYPSYVLSAAPSDRLKNVYSAWYYSMNAEDWLPSLAEEYRKANEALAPVQAKRIVGHRKLAPQVSETTYEGGYRIIVNYGEQAYDEGRLHVPAQDFVAVTGGEAS